MKINKQLANILFTLLLVASLFTTWKAIGFAGDLAMSGKPPMVWLNVLAFAVSIVLVGIAIYVRSRYGK